jgi:hypothetical protein
MAPRAPAGIIETRCNDCGTPVFETPYYSDAPAAVDQAYAAADAALVDHLTAHRYRFPVYEQRPNEWGTLATYLVGYRPGRVELSTDGATVR